MSSAITLRIVCACALAFLLTATHARGTITVEPDEYATFDGNNILLEVDGTEGYVVSVAATGEDSIGTITVLVTGGNAELTVTSEKNLFSIKKHAESTGRLWIWHFEVDYDVGAPPGGDRGVIEADYVKGVITAHRNIYADIVVTGDNSGHGPAIAAITGIWVTDENNSDPDDGSLWGDVIVDADDDGRIHEIIVHNTIGRSGGSLIQAQYIGSITAGHITDAHIDLVTLGGDEELVDLEINEGSWSGTLVAGTVTGRIQVEHTLFAEIELTSDPDPASVWWIGGDFDEEAIVLLPAGGLKHQIIVNGNDDGGEWEGVVQVGSGGGAIVLDGDAITDGKYTNTATSVGGGAVGLAT